MPVKVNPSVETTPIPPADQPRSKQFLVHPNLACLASLADKDRGRNMHVVRLQVKLGERPGEQEYAASSTNGRCAVLVEGECPMGEYPDIPSLTAVRDTPWHTPAAEALILASTWTEAFGLPISKVPRPVLANLAVLLGEQETHFASTDLERVRSLSTRNVEGRFIDVQIVFPKIEPEASVRVDAKHLIALLKVACEFADPESLNVVTLELRGIEDPLVIRSSNREQKFTGVLKPISR